MSQAWAQGNKRLNNTHNNSTQEHMKTKYRFGGQSTSPIGNPFFKKKSSTVTQNSHAGSKYDRLESDRRQSQNESKFWNERSGSNHNSISSRLQKMTNPQKSTNVSSNLAFVTSNQFFPHFVVSNPPNKSSQFNSRVQAIFSQQSQQKTPSELKQQQGQTQKLYKTNTLNKQSGISRTPSPKVGMYYSKQKKNKFRAQKQLNIQGNELQMENSEQERQDLVRKTNLSSKRVINSINNSSKRVKSRQQSIDTSTLNNNLAIPLSLQHSSNATYSRKNLEYKKIQINSPTSGIKDQSLKLSTDFQAYDKILGIKQQEHRQQSQEQQLYPSPKESSPSSFSYIRSHGKQLSTILDKQQQHIKQVLTPKKEPLFNTINSIIQEQQLFHWQRQQRKQQQQQQQNFSSKRQQAILKKSRNQGKNSLISAINQSARYKSIFEKQNTKKLIDTLRLNSNQQPSVTVTSGRLKKYLNFIIRKTRIRLNKLVTDLSIKQYTISQQQRDQIKQQNPIWSKIKQTIKGENSPNYKQNRRANSQQYWQQQQKGKNFNLGDKSYTITSQSPETRTITEAHSRVLKRFFAESRAVTGTSKKKSTFKLGKKVY